MNEALTAIVLADLSYNSPEYVRKAYDLAVSGQSDPSIYPPHIEALVGLSAAPVFLCESACGAKAYVLHFEKSGKLFVVFQGTQSLKNIETDLELALVQFDPLFKKCRVHDGFRQSFLALRNLIEAEIAKCPAAEIVFAGHSLGSGCATLAALWFAKAGRKVSYYGAGTPRVGDRRFKAVFNALVPRSIRFKYGRDIINTLPAWPYYRHVNREYHLGPKDYSLNYTFLSSVKCHHVRNYVSALLLEAKNNKEL